MQLSNKRQKLQIHNNKNYNVDACSQSSQTSMMTPLGVETSSKMLWSRWREEEEEGELLVREVGSNAISASMQAGRGRLSVDVTDKDSCCWLVVQKLFENCLALTRARLLRKEQITGCSEHNWWGKRHLRVGYGKKHYLRVGSFGKQKRSCEAASLPPAVSNLTFGWQYRQCSRYFMGQANDILPVVQWWWNGHLD